MENNILFSGIDYDVILLDSCGVHYNGFKPDIEGLGGSETEAIWLLEALAAKGLKVASINKIASAAKKSGVYYIPLTSLEFTQYRCKTLILQRYTPPPLDISFEKAIIWVTDLYSPAYDVHLPLFEAHDATLVGVSDYQLAQFPEGFKKRQRIYNSLPDWVYDLPSNRNTPANSFIYASANVKGLKNTLHFFKSLKESKPFKNATLAVLSPGYDAPAHIDMNGVDYKGALPFKRVVEEMQKCRNVLHVQAMPETFGISQTLAEVLGLNVFVLQAAGKDALSEVCNSKLITTNENQFHANFTKFATESQSFKPVQAKDYRMSTIVNEWLSLLKFAC